MKSYLAMKRRSSRLSRTHTAPYSPEVEYLQLRASADLSQYASPSDSSQAVLLSATMYRLRSYVTSVP